MLKRMEEKKRERWRGETQFFQFILDPTFWQLFLVGLGPTLSAYFVSLISFIQTLSGGEHFGGEHRQERGQENFQIAGSYWFVKVYV